MNPINQINLGSKFVRPIEPINTLIQAHSNVCQKIQQLQAFLYTKKLRGSWQRRVFFQVELWTWTLCLKVVLAIQHLLGCCLQINNIQKYYLVSLCVIFIIIVFATETIQKSLAFSSMEVKGNFISTNKLRILAHGCNFIKFACVIDIKIYSPHMIYF